MSQYTEEQFAKFIDTLFENHDINKDNMLDHTECKAAMQAGHAKFGGDKPFNDEAFDAAFKTMDTNGDNHVDKSELTVFLHKWAAEKGMLC